MTAMAAFALFCAGVAFLAVAVWFSVLVVQEVRRML